MKLFWAIRARVRNAHPDHHAIAKSMAWVSLFVFVGKLAGAAKEMAIAYRYGLSREVDAYLFVFNLVNWPIGVWFSVLTVVLVPLAARMRQAEPSELPRFRSELLGLVIVLGLALALAGWSGLPLLLHSSWAGLPPATAAIASDMAPRLAALAPLGVIIGLFSAWMLAAGRHTNTLLESTPALVILVALFAFPGGGAEPLVWGTLVGFACHLIALAVPLRSHGELEPPRFTRRSPEWTPFWRGFGIMLAGQALMSFTGVMDQFFAAHLGPGAIATLGYSNRILTLILGLGAVAVSRATLPVFSRAQAQGEEQVHRVANHWVKILFVLGTVTLIVELVVGAFGCKSAFRTRCIHRARHGHRRRSPALWADTTPVLFCRDSAGFTAGQPAAPSGDRGGRRRESAGKAGRHGDSHPGAGNQRNCAFDVGDVCGHLITIGLQREAWLNMNGIFYFLRTLTRPAYRIKGVGLGRLCEMARRWAARRAPHTPLLIRDFRGTALFRCFLREHMGGQIFFRGSYSGDQLTIMERLLDAHGVFIDAGANQGEFSIAAANVVPLGRVIAFEPVAEYRERLFENVRINALLNVEVIAVALGDEEGSLPIYDQPEAFSDGTRHEGLPSLFASEARSRPLEMVPIRRLDDVLQELGIARVDVIKLDIEGAEWMALRGAAKTLATSRPVLILELGRETCRAGGYEPEALVEWLASLDYRMEKVVEGGKTSPLRSRIRSGTSKTSSRIPNETCAGEAIGDHRLFHGRWRRRAGHGKSGQPLGRSGMGNHGRHSGADRPGFL